MKKLLLLLLCLPFTGCETTTVTNPDGSTTTKKSLPPAVATSLANGAVVVTGALAERIANELAVKAANQK